MVCTKKVSCKTPPKFSKRKRLNTSIKKRNIRYKPSSKTEEINCALCDFRSVSNVKVIRHMKSSHTQQISDDLVVPDNRKRENPPKVLVEDMSVCDISDDDELSEGSVEKLLIETKSYKMCDFEATDEIELQNHIDKSHGHCSSSNLNEHVISVEKPLPLYKCNECSFTTTATDNLKEHKKEQHNKEQTEVDESIFLHKCISSRRPAKASCQAGKYFLLTPTLHLLWSANSCKYG